MQPIAKVIEDSISPKGQRITTLQLKFPRFILPEFNTHRVFSRNASSSRAIPVKKMLEQVRSEPAHPLHWGRNQPGMQASEELSATEQKQAIALWREAAEHAALFAERMMELGLHKQVANRILEPYQMIHVIVTATEWANFFELRDHEDAQPEIRALARAMRAAMDASKPIKRGDNPYVESSWHLPYVTDAERAAHGGDPLYLAKLSAARCARVSYLTHDGQTPTPEKDLALYERLVGSRPIHASPTEHQAYPDRQVHGFANAGQWANPAKHANFKGWVQHRKLIEEQMYGGLKAA